MTKLNADNEDLGGFPGLAIPDEVRGKGAEEMPFMPTRYELLVLVKHWIEVAWDYDFAEWFLLEQTSSFGRRQEAFADRRISRIAELLGDEAVNAATNEAAESYAANFTGLTLKGWKAYRNGTIDEQEAFHVESRAEMERWQEERDNKLCTCGHRQENHCRRGTVGCLSRAPNHGEQHSVDHCAETDSCLCQGFREAATAAELDRLEADMTDDQKTFAEKLALNGVPIEQIWERVFGNPEVSRDR